MSLYLPGHPPIYKWPFVVFVYVATLLSNYTETYRCDNFIYFSQSLQTLPAEAT